MRHVLGRFFCGMMLGFTGCEISTRDDADDTEAAPAENATTAPPADAPPAPAETPQASVSTPSEALGAVTWLDPDISAWPETSSLQVRVEGETIYLEHSKASVWPAVDGLNGNAWIFVNQGGTWYAATWEYLKFGQTAKAKSSVAGNHIKKAPLQNFQPRSGEVYGFMVSGLIRSSARNVSERSNVVLYTWP